MKFKIILILVVLAGAITINALRSGDGTERRNEAWLESMVPQQVGDFETLPNAERPDAPYTYRMDEITYRTLKPIGIVGKIMSNPHNNRRFDVVVIAGDSMVSFHDQRWCFRAQGWVIQEDEYIEIPTENFGNVQALIARIQRDGVSPRWAMFTFRSPTRFSAQYERARWDFLLSEFFSGRPNEGFSFRFINLDDDGGTREGIIQFASEYLDTAAETFGDVLVGEPS